MSGPVLGTFLDTAHGHLAEAERAAPPGGPRHQRGSRGARTAHRHLAEVPRGRRAARPRAGNPAAEPFAGPAGSTRRRRSVPRTLDTRGRDSAGRARLIPGQVRRRANRRAQPAAHPPGLDAGRPGRQPFLVGTSGATSAYLARARAAAPLIEHITRQEQSLADKPAPASEPDRTRDLMHTERPSSWTKEATPQTEQAAREPQAAPSRSQEEPSADAERLPEQTQSAIQRSIARPARQRARGAATADRRHDHGDRTSSRAPARAPQRNDSRASRND
jgi:hypothetical protein